MVSNTNTATADNINQFKTTTGTTGTSSKTAAATTSLVSTTEDFLKLLTVQLQNQDPTKPLETDQITQQIASLSQVEQQINTNKNLEGLAATFMASQAAANVSYIGKMAEATGNTVPLSGGQGIVVYDLDAEAAEVQINVADESGNIVYQAGGTALAGRNQLLWDGTTDAGTKAPDGTYKISVVAKDASGAAIKATTKTAGVVTSVQTKDGTNYIALGDTLLTADQITSVRDLPVLAASQEPTT